MTRRVKAGEIDWQREKNMAAHSKRGVPLKICPECYGINFAAVRVCTQCFYQFPRKEKK